MERLKRKGSACVFLRNTLVGRRKARFYKKIIAYATKLYYSMKR